MAGSWGAKNCTSMIEGRLGKAREVVADPPHGLLGVDVGLVVLGQVLDRVAVLVQLEAGVGRGRVGQEAVELAVSGNGLQPGGT